MNFFIYVSFGFIASVLAQQPPQQRPFGNQGGQFNQQQQQQQFQQQRGFNQGGQFNAAVERPPPLGQRQGQFGPNNVRGLSPQQQEVLRQQQQQQQLQLQLSGQPSLVNIGGCSRGVSLRNSDGSTLVCGFGPRDFACPPQFSCTFDNGLRALVCCPENNTKPAIEEVAAENPCPEGEPIRDHFGNRLECNFAGGPANACPAGTLCVVGACCPVSVAGLISVKPGKCPLPLPVSPGQTCQNDCTFDADCPGPAKCCFVGCGARCVASVAPSSGSANENNAPQLGIAQLANPALAGPLSGNGVSLSQFNLQQRPQGGFGQNQAQNGQLNQNERQNGQFNPNNQFNAQNLQNNRFFNQQQQQFQFPNSGPPAPNGNGLRGPPGSGAQNNRRVGNGPPQFQPINSNRQFDQATD